jgi:hypothetical protein
MNRSFVAAFTAVFASLAIDLVHAQPASELPGPPKPNTYVLVAAIGSQFTEVTDAPRVGSHLPPFRRNISELPDNLLNRVVLNGLDNGISRVDPDSERVYLSVAPGRVDGVSPLKQSSVALARIVAALEKMPKREGWDRIVVALPAYALLTRYGMPGRIEGLGAFAESQCQAGCGIGHVPTYPTELDPEPLSGVEALTSEDEVIKAKTFLAPFSYIEVWVLDPRTFAVLDRQQGFDHQKLAERPWKPAMTDSDRQKYLWRRAFDLIETSVRAAVTQSVVNSRRTEVDVGPVKDVTPDDAKK